MNDFCMECGQPHPSVFVFTDDLGNERFVHERCASTYTKKLLGRTDHDTGIQGDRVDSAYHRAMQFPLTKGAS